MILATKSHAECKEVEATVQYSDVRSFSQCDQKDELAESYLGSFRKKCECKGKKMLPRDLSEEGLDLGLARLIELLCDTIMCRTSECNMLVTQAFRRPSKLSLSTQRLHGRFQLPSSQQNTTELDFFRGMYFNMHRAHFDSHLRTVAVCTLER